MQRRELMFAASGDPGHVFGALSSRWTVVADPPTTLEWTCLDTADWRLYRAGMSLRHTRRGRHTELVLDSDDRPRVAVPARVSTWPKRIEAMPDSEVRDLIAGPVGLRALLPLAEVGVRQIPLRLLDKDEKTRVRLRVDQQRLIGHRVSPLPLRVLIMPLRGYEKDADRAERMLTEAFAQYGEVTHASTVAFRAAGHQPGVATLNPPILDPKAPAPEEIARVLRHWSKVLEAVRPAVVQDVDIECLREFRSAARSVRALLLLAATSLPGADLDRYLDEFGWLAELAAPVREADVLLLEVDGRGSLDLEGIGHLDEIATQLRTMRRAPLRTLRSGLASDRWNALGPKWGDALDRLERGEVIGTATVASFAHAQVEAAFRRVVEVAGDASEDSPLADLVALRRRVRTLHVVLDTFSNALADPELVDPVVRAADSLHQKLGVVQDSVAASAQLSAAADHLAKKRAPTDVLLAIGALRDRADQRAAEGRRALAKPLHKVAGKKFAAAVDRIVRAT